jgi:hypothetical protein
VCTLLSWRAGSGRADLPALLSRFAATLSAVHGGLETLGTPQPARMLSPQEQPVLTSDQLQLVQELINRLRKKDTQADRLVAQLKSELGTAGWLEVVEAEVNALDYNAALDLLEQLGLT